MIFKGKTDKVKEKKFCALILAAGKGTRMKTDSMAQAAAIPPGRMPGSTAGRMPATTWW